MEKETQNLSLYCHSKEYQWFGAPTQEREIDWRSTLVPYPDNYNPVKDGCILMVKGNNSRLLLFELLDSMLYHDAENMTEIVFILPLKLFDCQAVWSCRGQFNSKRLPFDAYAANSRSFSFYFIIQQKDETDWLGGNELSPLLIHLNHGQALQ